MSHFFGFTFRSKSEGKVASKLENGRQFKNSRRSKIIQLKLIEYLIS